MQIDLKYGPSTIAFEFEEKRFRVLEGTAPGHALSDVEINEKLSTPLHAYALEDIVNPSESVLFVVPDATRSTGCGQIINLLIRRLIANGTLPYDIAVIFATGIHRKVTEAEKASILTPFIAQRVKAIDHDPRDLARLVRVGETAEGIPVELNRAVFDFDHVIPIGGISFHYFAGFTGGRKLICPGLASSRTITQTHRLAFDCDTLDRRAGVGPGRLDGNPVHEAFTQAAGFVKVSFAVSAIVDDRGRVTDLYCGDFDISHRAACAAYAETNTVNIDEPRDLVIVSCGGSPHDIDLIQAHKALESAANACTDGGEIILIAECPEGGGRADFLEWFAAGSSAEISKRLCAKYQVSGQTAWSFLRKAERFNVKLASSLAPETLAKLKTSASDILETRTLDGGTFGYIIPAGAKTLVTLS